MEPQKEGRNLTSSEESAKFIMRNGQPIAVYRKNGVLKFYKLIEVSYEDISEIFETPPPNNYQTLNTSPQNL